MLFASCLLLLNFQLQQIQKMKYLSLLILPFVLLLGCSSCNDDPVVKTDSTETVKTFRVKGPAFSSDSAYGFIKTQVDFGPRVPGTPGHEKCAAYLEEKLKSYGLTVTVQEGDAMMLDRKIRIKNIMGAYKPERKDRILLLAHWDTRMFADRDSTNKDKPIDGANDGGSGVGVLLEMARIIREKDPNLGIDFLFVDAEDNGQHIDTPEDQRKEDTWCLGTQYWATHKPAGYAPKYGILLDMVGAKNAVFPREGTSLTYASWLVDKVWTAAAQLGYGSTFVNDRTGETTDDHLYINGVAGIPCIDIVHYDPIARDYMPCHHRHCDNMDNIDKNTLRIVGELLVDIIYNEMPSQTP
ncbi:MAG: peptidase, M28 family [Bacteroidetes bacterium]|nr:MAG: peptidase, M28 family [Bacteroidota bacterium]